MKQATAFRKKLAGMALAVLVAATSLAGCGDAPEAKEATGNGTTESPQTMKKGTYTLSEAFGQKGTHIWYMVEETGNNIGKDSSIREIFVVQNGQVQAYNYNCSLGELAQLTDEEILEKLEENAAEMEERTKESLKEALEIAELALEQPWFEGLDWKWDESQRMYLFYDFSAWKTEYEQYKADLENYQQAVPGAYHLCIYTDPTGTKTATEAIRFDNTLFKMPECQDLKFEIMDGQICCLEGGMKFMGECYWESPTDMRFYADPLTENLEQIKELLESKTVADGEPAGFAEYVGIDSLNVLSVGSGGYKYIATGPVNAPEDGIQVYTSFYNGFAVGGDGSWRDGSLITRVDGTVNFQLDEAGTKGIVLDDKSF